ncbi:KAT8 regulatory NSL complex subunit 2 [Thrips palmi]|uniref:KAT8 regulatory NSL complex subunit 2 n=1 Tax=Thrips palmi TaxID=161013 RepID=A0A6P8ZNY9_THRPL|nr:KAT8 regulatory NSL complex subunit 2 [Thrips palmi]XP_034243184.1 KAT8 regulatory NSL complex subunit 2 [Thrips palmi]
MSGSSSHQQSQQPPPAPLSKAAAERALRDAKCRYKQYDCSLSRLDGYHYCMQHILEDKAAPYKPCSYVFAFNGRPCSKPAYKGDRRNNGLCSIHSRKEELKRQKSSLRHFPSPSTESLLTGLSHYVPSSQNLNTAVKEESSDEPLDPFLDMDASMINASSSRVLDYGSESDSDVDAAMLDVTWKGGDADADSSDAESVDSQQEDLLKHAGVYTSEEAMQVTRDKLIRLQSLYIEQFRRLQHVLRERRRKYLHSLKREKESLCSISSQPRNSSREQKLYEKLKALNHYHRRNGVEAVLHKKALERRASVTDGMNVRPAPFPKCVYTEGGVKCGARSLPVSKFCPKHILQDTHQVLFRPCGCKIGSDSECKEPLPDIAEDAFCVYHTVLPSFPKSKVEPKTEPTCLTQEEALKQEQEEQIQQISLQLQEQLEQQSLALPDSIDTDMDIVLDSKDQNFLNAF